MVTNPICQLSLVLRQPILVGSHSKMTMDPVKDHAGDSMPILQNIYIDLKRDSVTEIKTDFKKTIEAYNFHMF